MFERSGVDFLPVVELEGPDQTPVLQGALFHLDALKAYNQALTATAEEEHS
jgi:CIC family chloride channel protein